MNTDPSMWVSTRLDEPMFHETWIGRVGGALSNEWHTSSEVSHPNTWVERWWMVRPKCIDTHFLTNLQEFQLCLFLCHVLMVASRFPPYFGNRSSSIDPGLWDSRLASYAKSQRSQAVVYRNHLLVCHVRMIYRNWVKRLSEETSLGSHAPYSIPLSNNKSVPSLLVSHQGATLPFGGFPLLKEVRIL